MKKFLLAGIIAAVSAVAFVSHANAESRYCIYNPDDPACQDYYGNDSGYDQPSQYYDPPPPVRYSHRPRYYEQDQGLVLNFSFGSNNNGRCQEIANSLRNVGFRRVRAVDCAGRDFAYLARRDGQNLRVTVSSRNGRISKIRPY